MVRFSTNGSSAETFDVVGPAGAAEGIPSSKAGARERNGGIDALRAAVTLRIPSVARI